jgi:hypothetical protein
VTKRADLKMQREDKQTAVEKFGLDDSAFLVEGYRHSVTPNELSKEQMDEAVEMAGLGAFESAIARVLGVSESTFVNSLRKGKLGQSELYREWSDRFYEARKQHMKKNLRVMNEATENGDWKPAAWQLERSFGFHKQEVVEHEVGPQTLSLMQLAQIPIEDARSALEVEGEVIIEPDDAA